MSDNAVKKDAKKSKKQNPSFTDKVKVFWKGVSGEFRKIIWPSKDELLKQTKAVLVISVVLGAFIRLYDMLCQAAISFIK